MAHYLLQISYAPETRATLIRNPQDRSEAVRGAIGKLGGTIVQIWLAFGADDVVGVVNMPDNVAAAALSMAFSAGGACKSVKTTPLMSFDEGMDAMNRAAQCGYVPAHEPALA